MAASMCGRTTEKKKKQVGGPFIRIGLKIAKKYCLYLDFFFFFLLCGNQRFSLVFRFQARDECQMR